MVTGLEILCALENLSASTRFGVVAADPARGAAAGLAVGSGVERMVRGAPCTAPAARSPTDQGG